MFTSLRSFNAYACVFQDAWIRSVCVILGPAWVSVRGGGASWRKTARSAVTCAPVRHWKHPALAFTSTLYSSCCMWTVHYFKLQTNTADSLTCFAPQSLWMQCLLRHLLPKMWRSKSARGKVVGFRCWDKKTPECLQKSGRAALTHEAWCIICDTRMS